MEKHEIEYVKLKESGYEGWGGQHYSQRMDGWSEQLNKLLKQVDSKGSQVLEMGCGAGDVSIMLAVQGYQVTGVDISPTAVAWAHEKAQTKQLKTTFIASSVCDEHLLEGEAFDLIIDGNCLHCLFDEDRTAFYDNLKRLTKPEGYVFISSAVLEHEGAEVPVISAIKRCFVTKEDIQENLENRGFHCIKTWSSHGTHEHYYGIYQKG